MAEHRLRLAIPRSPECVTYHLPFSNWRSPAATDRENLTASSFRPRIVLLASWPQMTRAHFAFDRTRLVALFGALPIIRSFRLDRREPRSLGKRACRQLVLGLLNSAIELSVRSMLPSSVPCFFWLRARPSACKKRPVR